ncbi:MULTISPECIES: hypothetical protein [unclassified Streptococcus]|uniref:hypothetical protein n=1 Tax=Streptococcus TaxID=1301 RepID=UPI000DD93752|nr:MULTISPECIES: hypothetical protein [unclassified Streptococcus]
MKYVTYKLSSDGSYNNKKRKITGNKKKLVEAIYYSLRKRLVFRGIDKKIYKNFKDFIFIGGEKARFNLFKDLENDLGYNTLEEWNEKEYENFKLVLKHLKENFENFATYGISGDINAIIEKIKNYKDTYNYSYYDMYLKVLSILHIVQDKAPFQSKIPCVSTSRNKDIAQKIFSEKDDVSYTIVAFTNNSPECMYLETKKIKQFCNEIGMKGFKDKYNEVIFLDCIFPHNILGLIEKSRSGKEVFIVNPNLLKMIDKADSFDDLIKTLKKSGVEINQIAFYRKLKESSLYQKYIFQEERRRLIDEIMGENE